mgnify:CR=1 FL=1|jgi:hypothetical protein
MKNCFQVEVDMLYNIGDKLKCKHEVNTQCLEMTNPMFNIHVGDIYIVTDKDDYPDDNHCHWYELTSQKDKNMVLSAWNDEEHMIIDDRFEKV